MSNRYDYTVLIGGVDATAVFNKMGGPAVAQRYLADELLLVEAPKPEPPPEPVLDFIVRVDRSVKLSYFDWFKKLENPELECSGPAEYDLQTAVQQWLHDDQKNGVVVGNTIHKHLKKDNGLASCLNLQDGLAIQAKGIAVFRKLFAGKAVFLWGSVVQRRFGNLSVPYLYGDGGEVVVLWGVAGLRLLLQRPRSPLRQVALWAWGTVVFLTLCPCIRVFFALPLVCGWCKTTHHSHTSELSDYSTLTCFIFILKILVILIMVIGEYVED